MVILLMAAMALRSVSRGRPGYLLDAALVALALPLLLAVPPVLAPPADSLRHGPLSILAALAVFAVSVAATTQAPLRFLGRLREALLAARAARHARVASWALLVAGYEEIIWRGLCQSALQTALGSLPAILLTAAIFTFWHRHRIGASLLLMAELYGFAILLGAAFVLTGDLLLVVLLHAVRNYLIGMNPRHEHV